jgi:hypothetical protein
MSTKSSILYYHDKFHIYHDVTDHFNEGKRNTIYLSFDNVEFEASNNSITIALPPEIWEVIREKPAIEFKYLNKTDEELLSLAKETANENVSKLFDWRGNKNGNRGFFMTFCQIEPQWDMETALKAETNAALVVFMEEREQELLIFKKIEKYKKDLEDRKVFTERDYGDNTTDTTAT